MIEIALPNYPTHVMLSKSRRPQYYQKGDKIPKKYHASQKWDDRGRLVDYKGNLILKNPRTAGTPKLLKVNGQGLYNGNISEFARRKMVVELKKWFTERLRPYAGKVKSFPVTVTIEIHKFWSKEDLDNHWIYEKVIQDSMVAAGLMPDDNTKYIRRIEKEAVKVVGLERKIVLRIAPYKKND